MKIKYDGEIIGELPTDVNMILAEALEIMGIDVDPMWDWEKFDMER